MSHSLWLICMLNIPILEVQLTNKTDRNYKLFYNCRSILFTLNESFKGRVISSKIIETIKFCRTRIFYNILAFFGLQEGTIAEIEGLFVGHLWSVFESPDEFEPGSVEPDASVSFVASDWSDSIFTASVGSDFESSTSRFSFARRFWNQVMT